MPYLRNKTTGQVVFVPDGGQQVVPNRPGSEYQGPQAAVEYQGKVLQNQRLPVQTQGDVIDNRVKVATQPFVVRKAQAEAQSAENTAKGVTPEFIQQNQQRIKNMQALQDIIGSLSDQYEKNFRGNGGTSGRGRLAEIMPGSVMGIPVNQANQVFNSTAMRAGPFIKSLLFPGSKDTDAAAEYQQKIMPFIPQSNDSDEVIASKINQLRDLYKRQMGQPVAPPPPTNGGTTIIHYDSHGRRVQ